MPGRVYPDFRNRDTAKREDDKPDPVKVAPLFGHDAPTHLPLDILRKMYNHMVVDNLGTLFLALSDPTRRGIIERLSRGSATVNELAEPFAVSQQMISKHIAYLIRANIVVKTKRGRESVCTLKPAAIKLVSDWALEYRRFWDESFDKLDAVLADMKRTEASDD